MLFEFSSLVLDTVPVLHPQVTGDEDEEDSSQSAQAFMEVPVEEPEIIHVS